MAKIKVDWNKFVTQSSSSTTNPSNSTYSSPAPPKINPWDKDVLPKIEKNGLEKDLGYEATKFMKNAYNGVYASAMRDLKSSGNTEVSENLSSLQRSTWKMTNELNKENVDVNKVKAYYNEALNYQIKVQKALNSSDKPYRVNQTNGKILKAKEFQKQSNDPTTFENVNSTNIQVKKESSLATALLNPLKYLIKGVDVSMVNSEHSYKYLSDIDERHKETIKLATGSFVNMWTDQILSNAKGNSNHKADFNSQALNICNDILQHAAKYKTATNKDLAGADQILAQTLLQTAKTLPPNKRIDFYVQNNQKIKEIGSRLGYYGTTYIYDKYKKDLTDDRYFDAKAEPFEYLDDMTKIEGKRKIYEEYKGNAKTVKLGALQDALNGQNQNEYLKTVDPKYYKVLLSNVVSENGDIVSFDKFKNNLAKTFKFGDIKIDGQSFNIQGLEGSVGYEQKEEKFKELYQNLKKGYKQTLDKHKTVVEFNNSLYEQGIGAKSSKAVGYESVNLKTDETGLLKSFESLKQQNVSQLWKVLRNPDDGSFGKSLDAVILPGNVDLYSLSKDELIDYSKTSNQTMKTFLKGDPSDVTMMFLRNSNVPGYAQYIFKNNETGKSVTAVVNRNLLGSKGVKEKLYMNSYETLEEINFSFKNEKSLSPVYKNTIPIIKNPKIYFDKSKGVFALNYEFLNEAGKYKSATEYASGNLRLSEATKEFDRFIHSIE